MLISTMQYSTVQFSAVQCSAVQYSAVQFDALPGTPPVPPAHLGAVHDAELGQGEERPHLAVVDLLGLDGPVPDAVEPVGEYVALALHGHEAAALGVVAAERLELGVALLGDVDAERQAVTLHATGRVHRVSEEAVSGYDSVGVWR